MRGYIFYFFSESGSGLYTESVLSLTTHLHNTTHHDIDNDTVSISRLENLSVLFYNRIPKCGSSSVNNIIKELSKKNRFGIKFSRNYSGCRADKTEQVSEAANVALPIFFQFRNNTSGGGKLHIFRRACSKNLVYGSQMPRSGVEGVITI